MVNRVFGPLKKAKMTCRWCAEKKEGKFVYLKRGDLLTKVFLCQDCINIKNGVDSSEK